MRVHHHRVPPEEQARQARNPRLSGPTAEFWSVLRHDDCVRVLQQPEAFSSLQGPGPERRAPIGDGMLLTADDPAHRRQRRIANKGFLPKVVRAQEGRPGPPPRSAGARCRRTPRCGWCSPRPTATRHSFRTRTRSASTGR